MYPMSVVCAHYIYAFNNYIVDFSRKLQQVFDVCQNLNTDTSSYIAENQKRKEVSDLLNGEIVSHEYMYPMSVVCAHYIYAFNNYIDAFPCENIFLVFSN
jgi:disulfide oxidoreductase YuzD